MSDRLISLRFNYNAVVFYFYKTRGLTATATGSESLLYVLYCNIRSRCMSQGLQVGHEWSKYKIFSLNVLRNVILISKGLLTTKTVFKMHFMTYSS